MKSQVTVLNQGTFQIRSGLGFQALKVSSIQYDCRKADCGICLIRVTEGAENLSSKTPAEQDFLKAMHCQDSERLACQTNILGDVTIDTDTLTWVANETPVGISLSQEALTEAKRLASENPDFANLPLRLYLDGKGCDGFTYGVTFDQESEKDFVFVEGDITIVVDLDTLQFTDGSHIEWVDDERGTGFLVNNPKQNSFRGKFYKQESWKQRLIAQKESSASAP